MITLSFQTLIIYLLFAFIVGMTFGVIIARPRGEREARDISIKLTEDQLRKRKRLDDEDVLDLTKWKPPSDNEIDLSNVLRDFEKKSKGK